MTLNNTIRERSCESQYAFLEKRQALKICYIGIKVFHSNTAEGKKKLSSLTLNRGTLFLCLVIYACLAVGINSERYLGDRLGTCTIVAVRIKSLVLDKVFPLNFALIKAIICECALESYYGLESCHNEITM